ncbi:hypothetical protein [Brevibacillus migulae]|uniref:hypothetical protein n=1 Tax=Brevibacillus migulae TaxID=1644114 RepID=UPI00106E771B|nr:hypothetical protein [Brevibacillus migulae]
MKKLWMLLIAFALVFAPHAGGFDQVDAKKSYSSGKKSFNSTTTPTKSDTHVNTSKPAQTTTPVKSPSVSTPSKGGFMKGILFGGLAGLMFGSLLSSLGSFGGIIGLLINILAIYVLFSLVRRIYRSYKASRRHQDVHVWKR